MVAVGNTGFLLVKMMIRDDTNLVTVTKRTSN